MFPLSIIRNKLWERPCHSHLNSVLLLAWRKTERGLRNWVGPSASQLPHASWLRPVAVPLLALPGRQDGCGTNSNSIVIRRWKHSALQVKRLFKRNPARARVEARMGIDRTPILPPPPQFTPVWKPTILRNGWSAPPDPSIVIPTYPFQIKRTKNKPCDAIGFLPIYTKLRKDGTKTTTLIKKIIGDRAIFEQELRSVLQIPMQETIRTHVGGAIEVNGNRVREVREWLYGLGF